jgi:hypothetical protein
LLAKAFQNAPFDHHDRDEHPLTECMAFGVEGFPFSQTGGLLKRYRRADDRDPNAVRSLTRSEAPSPLDGEAGPIKILAGFGELPTEKKRLIREA